MTTLITMTGICAAMAVSALAADDDAARKGKGDGKGAPNPEEMFNRLDADKSGGVSLEEYKANPRAKDQDPAKVEEQFNRMAGDDGIISLKEFGEAMKKMRGGKGGPKGDAPAN